MLNSTNSALQRRHLYKAKFDRCLDITETKKFKNNPSFEKAKKSFNHMPDYGTRECANG